MEDSRKTAPGEVPCESPVCEQTLPHPEVVACVRAQMPDPGNSSNGWQICSGCSAMPAGYAFLRHYSIPRCAYAIWLSCLG